LPLPLNVDPLVEVISLPDQIRDQVYVIGIWLDYRTCAAYQFRNHESSCYLGVQGFHGSFLSVGGL
jgi:hypothetical protein